MLVERNKKVSSSHSEILNSFPLLLLCPHGNNNLALDTLVLGACWWIICTSSWTTSNTLHWMTGGRHRSAKCRDLRINTRWELILALTLRNKGISFQLCGLSELYQSLIMML